MTPFQMAYLEVVRAQASLRGAQDCEAQVAHWVAEGRSTYVDLIDARSRVGELKRLYRNAAARYRNHSLHAGCPTVQPFLSPRQGGH